MIAKIIATFILLSFTAAQASREDDARESIRQSFLVAKSQAVGLVLEDIKSATGRVFNTAFVLEGENQALENADQLIEQLRADLLREYGEIEAKLSVDTAVENSNPEAAITEATIVERFGKIRSAIDQLRWAQPRQQFLMEALPGYLHELGAELAAKCSAGRSSYVLPQTYFEPTTDFRCDFYWQATTGNEAPGRKTQPEAQGPRSKHQNDGSDKVMGLNCTASAYGDDSLSRTNRYLQTVAGNLGPGLGTAVVGGYFALAVGALTALDTLAENIRESREIVGANKLRFEGMATSADVVRFYKESCSESLVAFNKLVDRILASMAGGHAQANAGGLQQKLAKDLKKNADGTIDFSALDQDQMLELAESMIYLALSNAQSASMTDQVRQRVSDLHREAEVLRSKLLSLVALGRAIRSSEFRNQQVVQAELQAEKSFLQARFTFFKSTSQVIEAVFGRIPKQTALSGIDQNLSVLRSTQVAAPGDPRFGSLEKAYAQLRKVL